MTVNELIAELSNCDGDAEVISEGCDCLGEVEGVTPAKNFFDGACGLFAEAREKNQVILVREGGDTSGGYKTL